MTHSKKEKYFNNLLTIIIFLIFIGATNYRALPSPGGVGLMVPINVSIWISIVLLIVISFYKIALSGRILLSKITIPMIFTLLLMIIPGIFQSEAESREVVLRILQVIGFFLLYFSFSQFRLSARYVNNILYIILFSAFIQLSLALGQLYHKPESTPLFLLTYLGVKSPPVGTLMQVNVMAIFMVTSLVISFSLLFKPSFYNQAWYKKLLLFLIILGGSYLVSTIGSRAALVALFLSLPLIIFSQRKKIIKRKKWFSILMVSFFIGSSSGFYFSDEKSGLNKLENKTTQSRTLAWKLSIQAIKNEPVFGHGLGGFTKAYFDQNEKHTKSLNEKDYKSTAFFTHPHNELLYWWVESGITSVIAIIVFIFYYLTVLFSRKNKKSLEYLAILIPIAFHTQVSLPFYLSSLLMIVFVFILFISTKKITKEHNIPITNFFKTFIIILSTLAFFSYTLFIKETVSGIETLQKISNSGSKNFHLLAKEINNPYWGDRALTHAHAISMSNEYNAGNIEKATGHLEWIEKKVLIHEDPSYYSLLLKGYKLFNDKEKYDALTLKLQNRYPDRF